LKSLRLYAVNPVSKKFACFAMPYFTTIDGRKFCKIDGDSSGFSVVFLEDVESEALVYVKSEIEIDFKSDLQLYCYFVNDEKIFCGYYDDFISYVTSNIDEIVQNDACLETLASVVSMEIIENALKVKFKQLKTKSRSTARDVRTIRVAKDGLINQAEVRVWRGQIANYWAKKDESTDDVKYTSSPFMLNSIYSMTTSIKDIERTQQNIFKYLLSIERKQRKISKESDAFEYFYDNYLSLENKFTGIQSTLRLVPTRLEKLLNLANDLPTKITEKKTMLLYIVFLVDVYKVFEDFFSDFGKLIERVDSVDDSREEIDEIKIPGQSSLRKIVVQRRRTNSSRSLLHDYIGRYDGDRSMQNEVIELSIDGWKIEEIAKTKKIPLEEVESILKSAHIT
jgi:hypothetical protein